MEKYKNYYLSDIVKNKEWIDVRKKLLNKWTTTPSKNVSILKNYVRYGAGPKELRLIRVKNYITGTAFRIGKIKNKEIDKLKKDINLSLKS